MEQEKLGLEPLSRNQFSEEYPHSDQIQFGLLILFLTVWALDSFPLKMSTALAGLVPLALRLPIAGALMCLGLLFVKRSHNLVIDEKYVKPTLVDTGIYLRVRHPMYLGVLLLYLGLSLSTLSLVSLGLWLGAFVAYDRMADYEEQDLIRVFGQEYSEYMLRVPRWIPRFFIKD